VTATYQFSPKINIKAGLALSNTMGGLATAGATGIGATKTTSAFLNANYAISPFSTVTASYKYSDEETFETRRTQNLIMLSLGYQPR
jgi:predicted porin